MGFPVASYARSKSFYEQARRLMEIGTTEIDAPA